MLAHLFTSLGKLFAMIFFNNSKFGYKKYFNLLVITFLTECWNFWTVHLFRLVEKDKAEIM